MPDKALKSVPEGMHALTVHLWFNGNCEEAIAFYEKAFGAQALMPPVRSPDGKSILHVMMGLGDSQFMMADACSGGWEQGPRESATAGLYLYVDDCDSALERAVAAGCEALMPPEDAFWGDRYGQVKDPYGHCWGIATQKWLLSPEEMAERQREWFEKQRV